MAGSATAPKAAAGDGAATRLNPTDAALWDIERDPTLRTTIVAAFLLDRPVEQARLVEGLDAATRLLPRLRQRVVTRRGRVGPPFWEIDPDFRLERHLTFVDAPGGVDDRLIAEVVEPLASSAMDRSRPLWECVHVGGSEGPAALVLRVHHTLTDGVGGIALLDAVLDVERGRPPRTSSADGDRPARGRADPDARKAPRTAFDAPMRIAGAAASAATHPLESAGQATSIARSTARLLAPTSAPLSPLMRARGSDRQIGMVTADLDRLRRAAHAHDCTLNHVFFAGVLGGLAEYHRAHGHPADALRVTMPVNVRHADDPTAGNQWAPVRFVVPMDVADPLDRMFVMRELANSARREPALRFSQSVAGLLQVLPPIASSAIVGGMMRGVDLTLTNVPGLVEPHYLHDAEVRGIYAFAPTAGAALNAALVSNVDAACIGLLCDAAAVTDADELRGLVEQHLEEVVRAAERQAPGPPPAPQPVRPGPPERLSALDSGFLLLETARTPMHIGGAMILDGGPLRDADGRVRIGDIRRHVEARLRHLPRFRRRIAEVPLALGRPVWVDDEHFDIARHVRLAAVPAPGGRDELLDLCAQLFEVPLDRGSPLWELWVVDGLSDGRVGIVEKVHHCLIDGVSGVELAAVLFDPQPQTEPERPHWRPVAPAPSARQLADSAIRAQLGENLRTVGRTAQVLTRAPRRVGEQLQTAATAARELARTRSTQPLAFNRPVGRRRVLRDAVLDLELVDRVRRPLDASVNDVVLACVTTALRRSFAADPRAPSEVQVLVPVSTRRAGMAGEPGNRVGGAIVALPVGEPDAVRRLTLIRERTRAAKADREGEAAGALLGALDHLPPVVDGLLARLFASPAMVNLVVTNVGASPQPLYFLGARMNEAIPVVPLGPRLGLGIAALSYGSRLTVSLLADPAICPGVGELAADVCDALDELVATGGAR